MACNKCKSCGYQVELKPDRVSVWGMYSNHLFRKYEGSSIEEIVNNWREHIKYPTPAEVGGHFIDDLGPTSLCPVIVLCGDKELRRVGKMIHVKHDSRSPSSKDVEGYIEAVKNDPDICRILKDSNA